MITEKINPEDITLQCSCGRDITVQQDVDNEGLCDPCIEGRNELWANEMKYEAKEYRDMKI